MTRNKMFLGAALLILSCRTTDAPPPPHSINHEQMLLDLQFLANDSLRGRKVGTHGNIVAREYIEHTFASSGLQPLGSGYLHPFVVSDSGRDSIEAGNVVGLIRGTSRSELAIVISAHFDHLGTHGGRVFNGADDNASGTAALLELARLFSRSPPKHDIVFLATDAEERGMLGAYAFVDEAPLPLERIALNINMDMISHSDSVLYASGAHPFPQLRPYLESLKAKAGVTLLLGHDDPSRSDEEDWTNSSDQAPFHAHGIPWVYFGVEDHEDYHRPTDDFDTINPAFYEQAVETILAAVKSFDNNLEALRGDDD